MAKKDSREKSRRLILALIIFLVIVLIVLMVAFTRQPVSKPATSMEQANVEYVKAKEEQKVKDLSGMGEEARMEMYCGNFFKLIDNENYEEAYKLLYSEYKENYFPTLANFTVYCKEYFPSSFSLSYTDIQRLGDIYVLMVSVTDSVNGKYGHNFSMYVVLQENELNDYVISFSRNSAVEGGIEIWH